jgi:hypothetical protein
MSSEDSLLAFNSMQAMEKIATNNIGYAVADSAINRYMAKMVVYRKLRNDTNAIWGSATLRAFHKQMQNGRIEKLFKIEDAFLAGDISAAQTAAATINPVNIIEQNHLTYYNLLAKSKKDTLDSNDSNTLYELAASCPYSNGTIVYQARALYNALNRPYVIFKDNCRNNNTSRLATVININTLNYFDAFVYPNPNLGKEIFINTLTLDKGTVAIRLTDLEGRTIVENNCTVTDGLSNFKITDIKNGVYFVHITNNSTGEHIVKKIVIQY